MATEVDLSTLQTNKRVGILGTGDYSRALAKNLLKAGYGVVCGSRDPRRRNFTKIDPSLTEVQIVTHTECLQQADIIFLCIHVESHQETLAPLVQDLKGKVVVDVSNPRKKNNDVSNAEKLQMLLPASNVVKAFNTISAYSLESDVPTVDKQVLICGNNEEAKGRVQKIAQDMGFVILNCGGLQQARELENMPLYLFPGWGIPSVMAFGVLLFWTIFAIGRLHIYEKNPWSDFPVYSMNKILACNAITFLALCFLPGSLAAILQIGYGSKYRRFPAWMDYWLKARKQLGLFSLLSACIHGCLSVILFQPGYFPWFFKDFSAVISTNATQDTDVVIMPKIDARGGGAVLGGVLALAVMAVLGITSIPAVGKLLNWKEWKFAQSHLGYLCLVLAAGHAATLNRWNFAWFPLEDIFLTMPFASLLLPFLALALKILLTLPCIDAYVWRIRRGYERGITYDADMKSPQNSEHFKDGTPKSTVRATEKFYTNEAYQENLPMSKPSNGSTVISVNE